MIITLRRIAFKPKYTIGKLYIDGNYVCDTIEDTDRNLDDSMIEDEIKKKKVYGETAIPLFKYLKSQKGFEGFGKGPKALAMSALLSKMDKDYKNNSEIKWNFTKFVIDREGNVVARFEPTAKMDKVAEFVESLL